MKDRVLNPIISFLTVVLVLLACEVGLRAFKNEFSVKNFLVEHIDLFRSAYPVQYNADLGWIPKPGTSGEKNIWGTQVTIREDGVRSNLTAADEGILREIAPILVVGDSFTFGDEVSDNETWPAILESYLHREVINAGVFGYGLDQTYLRAVKVLSTHKPEFLIFSFIPDDVHRCELSVRTGVSKPYFEIKQDSLFLRNIPVPPPRVPDIGRVRQILGYSFFCHKLMLHAFPNFWMHGLWEEKKAHKKGQEVACRLLQRLAEISNLNGTTLIVLVQYPADNSLADIETVKSVLACLDHEEVQIVDLHEALLSLSNHDSERYRKLFGFSHLTVDGNRFVAEILKKRIVWH